MKRALISVSDKTGIIEFAQFLSANGFEIVSTGGTRNILRDNGIAVTGVSEVTEFPECLDGRVKTLHPNVHAGILAIRGNKDHMLQLEQLRIKPIDMVVVNLYPFKETIKKIIQKETVSKESASLEDAIENIDIGGPSMLRAAAKNYQTVSVITDPSDYCSVMNEIRENGFMSEKTNFQLAAKAFAHSAYYDSMIASYLGAKAGIEQYPQTLTLAFEKIQDMRYGENPHQSAAFYKEPFAGKDSIADIIQLHGKELSFNNINDTNGALGLLKEFSKEFFESSIKTVVACKHANPCGVGSADDVNEAFMKAFKADPKSIFGGIIVCNGEIDKDTAEEINKIFVEIIAAPSYTDDALEILTKKKNIRILKINISDEHGNMLDFKKVSGGLLVQSFDDCLLPEQLNFVTKRRPTEKEMEDLIFSWKIVKHVKSNAIAIGKDRQSIGIGPGQVNRIWACKQAIEHGMEFLGADSLKGAALASDAYFPFPDCAEEAAKAGITCIIQPGGSKNDIESINVCDKYDIAMVFTGIRHFKH